MNTDEPTNSPAPDSEWLDELYSKYWHSEMDGQEFKAAILAKLAEAHEDELRTIKDSREVQVVDDGNAWCDFCYMELIEGSEQDCACLIIARKRIAALRSVAAEGEET